MEANAGKLRRPIERLLIQHVQIKQKAAMIGKEVERKILPFPV
jgi:hypothetical protein